MQLEEGGSRSYKWTNQKKSENVTIIPPSWSDGEEMYRKA